jgi:hypothetical protein
MRWEDCRSTKVESFARARKQRRGQRLCGTGLGQRHERQLDAARVITSGLPTIRKLGPGAFSMCALGLRRGP